MWVWCKHASKNRKLCLFVLQGKDKLSSCETFASCMYAYQAVCKMHLGIIYRYNLKFNVRAIIRHLWVVGTNKL